MPRGEQGSPRAMRYPYKHVRLSTALMGKRTFFLKILEDRRNNPPADRSQQGDVYCQRLGRSPSAATQECMPVHVPG